MIKLRYNSEKTLLREILSWLMTEKIFDPFRPVGGTALSLQLGHRESDDVGLSTEIPYGEIDFDLINKHLKADF